MSLNRFYKVFEMGLVVDRFEEVWSQNYHYVFTGTIPAWFNKYQLSALFVNQYRSNFDFTPPQGTSGSFTFGVERYDFLTSNLVDTGIININVNTLQQAPIDVVNCNTANLVWFNPIGGWQSFIFSGKNQAFQDEGKANSFINSGNEMRWASKEDIYQGVRVTSGRLSPDQIEYVSSLFKSIQVYLWNANSISSDWPVSIPINIKPKSVNKVRDGESYAVLDFEFRHAVADVVQTQ